VDARSDFLSRYRPAPDATLPEALAQRYEILSCLKRRGEGQVLLLEDRGNGSRFVMKVAPVGRKALFEREHALLMRLHDDAFPHPGLCFDDGARAYLMRQYVPGRSLKELVEDEGPLDEARAVGLARGVCAIVARLHGAPGHQAGERVALPPWTGAFSREPDPCTGRRLDLSPTSRGGAREPS